MVGRIEVRKDGEKWAVFVDGEKRAEADTNARAWREADRLTGQPDSRSQDNADWSFRRSASGE